MIQGKRKKSEKDEGYLRPQRSGKNAALKRKKHHREGGIGRCKKQHFLKTKTAIIPIVTASVIIGLGEGRDRIGKCRVK